MILLRSFVLFFIIRSFQAKTFGMNEVISCNEEIRIEDSLEGTIQTLGYPEPYPMNRRCKILFKGNKQHRVILEFRDFDLFSPDGHKHKEYSSCNGLDRVRIYDGLSDKAKILGEYCGQTHPHRLMSSGPNLSLRLTSHTSGKKVKGYQASYSFVSNFGITSGRQLKMGKCSFEFNSDSNTESTDIITSPNPGGRYPRNTNCTYFFTGTFLLRVLLNFSLFDLEGIEPCTAKSGSDFLEFRNFPDRNECPSRRCGRFKPQQVISQGPDFRMTFRSNDRLQGSGFSATYEFLTDEELPPWANYLKGYATVIDTRHAALLFLQLRTILFIIGKIT